jgi:hypothetical protein
MEVIKKKIRNLLIHIHKILFYGHYVKALTLLEPSILAFKKVRFGKTGDGSYILPLDLIENCEEYVLLSFGVADDISFEKDFKRHFSLIETHVFDPTINSIPEYHPDISFHKIGISGKNKSKKNLLMLEEIFDLLALNRQQKCILKLDVEGWEWGVLSGLENRKLNIPIIIVELHFFPLTKKRDTLFLPFYFFRKYKILKKLLKKFYIYHLHANNYEYLNFKNFKFPTYVELTLINKELLLSRIIDDVKLFNEPTFSTKEDFQFPFFK